MSEQERRIRFQGNFNSGIVKGGMHFSAENESDLTTPDKRDQGERPSIFVSHSHVDATLAQRLVSLLTECLCLPSASIRCSSMDGFNLPAGSHIDTELRRDLSAALIGIVLVTPGSKTSTYVPSEIGALWVNADKVIQIMAGGDPSSGPLTGYLRINGQSQPHVCSMLETISKSLGREMQAPSRWMTALTQFCSASAQTALVNRE